ncbi:MAG: hypothetical protein KDD46_06985 [Bdellovibrionales bacterium]|nr:hypothetical protein [Bdellovibrionales bacterium]
MLTFAFSAQAVDRTGEFALGYQSSIGANGTQVGEGNWSVKYGLASNTNLQFLLGFGLGDVADTSYTFGARFLYDLIENENSDFYVGLGAAFTGGDGHANAGGDLDGTLNVQVPLGFAFSLANAPAVEFSAEMGLTFNYPLDSGAWTLATNGGGAGTVFTAGAHYYF